MQCTSLRWTLRHTLAPLLGMLSLLALVSCGASPTTPDATVYAVAVSGDSSHHTDTTTIYALNSRTGATLWRIQEPGSAGVPGLPLAVTGGVVYAVTTVTTYRGATIGSLAGHLYAFSARTGKVLWRQDTPNAMLRLFGATSRLLLTMQSAAPGATANNQLQTLVARNPQTGVELWHTAFFTERSGYPYPTVLPIALTDDALYLAETNSGASPSDALYFPFALDPSDGSLLRQFHIQLPGGGLGANSGIYPEEALLANGMLYITVHTAYGSAMTWNVLAFDARDGSSKWTSASLREGFPELGRVNLIAAAGGRLYALRTGTGFAASWSLLALDAINGGAIWSTPTDTGSSPGAGRQALDAGALYITLGNRLVAVDAAHGTARWKTPVNDGQLSAPEVNQGTIYVGLSPRTPEGTLDTPNGYIEAFNAANGSLRWRVTTDGGVTSPPIVVS